MNTIFLEALSGKNESGRPPLWLMRQAGRYMHEYRKLREKYSFLGMCGQPELIAEVTELPIKTFGFDAAIIFSDILLIVESFGLKLRFEENEGPILEPALQTADDVKKLHCRDLSSRFSMVVEGVKLLKGRLKVPLLGFAGAPFTVASYMIEGKSSRDLKKTKAWMLKDPESFSLLLDKIADATAEYLNMLIDAGVDGIQLFDSWAHVLAWKQFEEYSLTYLKRVMSKLKPCPVILFCRGASAFYEGLATIHPQAISLDWQCDIQAVRKRVPQSIALQGNLDPDILLGDHRLVTKEAKILLEKMRGSPSFIFNLGHGILPTTPEDNVRALVECVKEFT